MKRKNKRYSGEFLSEVDNNIIFITAGVRSLLLTFVGKEPIYEIQKLNKMSKKQIPE